MAAYVQVVLQETLNNVGASGSVVRVRPGFARNYLIPRQLAVYATERNMSRLEHEKREAVARAAKLRGEAEALAQVLKAVFVRIERSVGAEDRMYGSVTTKDIAAALSQSGHPIDRRKIVLQNPIKALGAYDVSVRLSSEVNATFKVEVIKVSTETA